MQLGLSRFRFTDTSLFEQELTSLGQSHWTCLGRIPGSDSDTIACSGKPGMPFRVESLGGCSVILAGGADTGVKAFHNVCRHRGTRLLERETGQLKNGCVVCPYHAWTYDSSGRLIGTPNMVDEAGFDRADFGLLPVAVHTWGGYVFGSLSAASLAFEDFIQPLADRLANWNVDDLRLVKKLEYTVQANWKILFQNYSECYHCPTVHPALNRVTPYRSATNDLTKGPILGGPMELAEDCETVSETGKAIGAAFPGLTPQQARSVFYYTVFPNWFISAHPDYVMVHRLTPEAVNRTRITCEFLVDPSVDTKAARPAWEMWDRVNQEDWKVCELTQSGVTSPAYVPGPYSSRESMLVAWDDYYVGQFPQADP